MSRVADVKLKLRFVAPPSSGQGKSPRAKVLQGGKALGLLGLRPINKLCGSGTDVRSIRTTQQTLQNELNSYPRMTVH